MDIDNPHPHSVTVFEKNEHFSRQELEDAELEGKEIHIDKLEEKEEVLNAKIVLVESIKNEYTSYTEDAGFVEETSEVKRASTGFVSYDVKNSLLVVYGKKSIAGAIVQALNISSLQEKEMTPSLVEEARNLTDNLSSAKLLFPGNDVIKKISIQGNDLTEGDIDSYSQKDYKLISFFGKFTVEDIDLSCRITSDSVVLYVPGRETMLSDLNDFVLSVYDLA